MLKVINISPIQQQKIKADEYTFSVEWGEWKPSKILYWRTGDFHKSLIEIGLEEPSFRLASITLALVEHIYQWRPDRPHISALDIPQEVGLPICQTNAQLSNLLFFDEPGLLTLYIGQDAIRIEIGDSKQISSCIKAKNVSFGLDKDKTLSVIEITKLSKENMAFLNNKFKL